MMRMVKATEAIEVEFKDGQLKVVGGHHTLGYCLDNWNVKKELGNRQHFSTWNQKGWQLNSDDDTISPAGTRHMVLGWKGHSQLVDRNDRERLQVSTLTSHTSLTSLTSLASRVSLTILTTLTTLTSLTSLGRREPCSLFRCSLSRRPRARR